MPRYSNDFRKLIAQKFQKGISIKTICEEFNIGEDTAYRWRAKLKAGTLYDIVKLGGHPIVYDYKGLKDFVDKYPDKILREIKDEFFAGNACLSGIDKALTKMKFRLKKKYNYTKNETTTKDNCISKN